MGRAIGFEAIILAGGRGSRLGELPAAKDKPLLPVGNHPMIYYSLKLVEAAGFSEVHVICQDTSKLSIEECVTKSGINLSLRCHTLPSDCDLGTAEAIKPVVAQIIAPEVIILSSDLLSSVPLRKLVNKHIAHESSLTALFSRFPDDLSTALVPGQKSKFIHENDIVGMDENSGRLVYLTAQADLDETITLGTRMLKTYPHLHLTSRMWDAHAYVVKKWLLDYMVDAANMSMFKAEFLPHVVKKQFARPTPGEEVDLREFGKMQDENRSSDQDDDDDTQNDPSQDRSNRPNLTTSTGSTVRQNRDIFNFVKEDETTSLLREMSLPWEFFGNPCRKMLDSRNKIRCYALVVDCGGQLDDAPTCIRANNLMTYVKANLEAANAFAKWNPGVERVHPSAQISGRLRSQLASTCLVGEAAVIAEKVTIKNTVVGARCRIGDKSKIFNTVLMDDCVIGEGVSLQDCVVCEGAVIGERADLRNCVIAYKHNTPASTKAKNEVLSDNSMMLDS